MTMMMRIFGTVLLLAAMLIAPAQGKVASITAAPMMAMADGSPCPQRDCATMPDCPTALPGGMGMLAVPTADVWARLLPAISSDVLVMTDIAATTPIHGDGLRRPPKI